MHVDRWNRGRMRRYRFPTGTLLVVSRTPSGRRVSLLPAFCSHIAIAVEPQIAADALRQLRQLRQSGVL